MTTEGRPAVTLTAKQSAFVDEYLLDLNATQAAIRAGYAKKHAHVTAARLLSNAKVKPYLEAAMKARSERTQIDADYVLKRLHGEAEADLADLYDENNSLRPVSEWPEIWRTGLVASVQITIAPDATRVEKLRLSDRLKRIELIGRHVDVGAFVKRAELTGRDGGPLQFEDVTTMTDEQLRAELLSILGRAAMRAAGKK